MARLDQDVLASLNKGIDTWTRLGRVYNLDETRERARLASGNFESTVPIAERYLGCFTTNCPCHGRKQLHGNMRVCKGCWNAVYCRSRCQTRYVIVSATFCGFLSSFSPLCFIRDWERGIKIFARGVNDARP